MVCGFACILVPHVHACMHACNRAVNTFDRKCGSCFERWWRHNLLLHKLAARAMLDAMKGACCHEEIMVASAKSNHGLAESVKKGHDGEQQK